MFTYSIKHNGYPVGQAKGKAEAVHRIRALLKLTHEADRARWSKNNGTILCTVITGTYEQTYTIEKD